jgi:hypothetical protein
MIMFYISITVHNVKDIFWGVTVRFKVQIRIAYARDTHFLLVILRWTLKTFSHFLDRIEAQ